MSTSNLRIQPVEATSGHAPKLVENGIIVFSGGTTYTMGVRTVTRELEAKLTGKSRGLFSRPSGKLERKSYQDGGERLKISIRNLKIPTPSNAVIKVDNIEIEQIPIVDGFGGLDTETEDSDDLPGLAIGQTIEVIVNGDPVLTGVLYVD